MTDWKQAQQNQWQNNMSEEYSEDEYTDDDDEYEPIEATTWGSQSVAEDGTTNVSLTVSGWQSLIDPNIKTKAGGIGSGQLHRRGANYQPIDEQTIIDRRLGKPVPKGGLGGKKKKSKKPKGGAGFPPPPPPSRRPVPSSMVPPSSSAHRGREAITTGPWGSSQLSSTPFWEQPANKAGNGSLASKYASPAAVVAAANHAPPPQPQAPPLTNHKPNPIAPAVAPSTPIQPLAPAPQPFVRSSHGSAASKYASPAAVSAAAAAPPPLASPTSHQPSQQQLQQLQPVQSPPAHYQHQPTPPIQSPVQQYRPDTDVPTVSLTLEKPIINMKVELGEGCYVSLPVYASEPPANAVKRFESQHHLHLDQYHKDNIRKFIEFHVQQYNERQNAKAL